MENYFFLVYFTKQIITAMKKPYTLNLPEEVIQKADHFAASQGLELQSLMEEYMFFLANKADSKQQERIQLREFLDELHREFDMELEGNAKRDYRRYLIEKYR